ncbi:MAG: SMI1/KNR4 family protein [Planctomycetaceae bacterium]
MKIDNEAFFELNPGIDVDSIAAANAMLRAPFSDDEVSRLSQYLDSDTVSRLPKSPSIRELPESYVTLLARSNGGGFTIGEREVAYFDPKTIRDYLVDNQFPIYMPGALPFGLNGGGVFYVFDMREPAVGPDYPILAASSGNLCYYDSPVIARTLDELVSDTRNIEELM